MDGKKPRQSPDINNSMVYAPKPHYIVFQRKQKKNTTAANEDMRSSTEIQTVKYTKFMGVVVDKKNLFEYPCKIYLTSWLITS